MVFSFQLITKTCLMIYWKVNQDKIIAEFCVNKSKPELKCGGCCHLKKQLDKTEEVESQDLTKPIEQAKPKIPELESFILSTKKGLDNYMFIPLLSFMSIKGNLYDYMPSRGFFHPPEIV